jgi:hypothetical protein
MTTADSSNIEEDEDHEYTPEELAEIKDIVDRIGVIFNEKSRQPAILLQAMTHMMGAALAGMHCSGCGYDALICCVGEIHTSFKTHMDARVRGILRDPSSAPSTPKHSKH